MPQSHTKSERESPPSTPRWVKLFGIITLIVLLLLAIAMLLGDGQHGPRRHTPSNSSSIPLYSVIASTTPIYSHKV